MAAPTEQAQIRIQDFAKLQMWTPTPGVEGKRAKMGFAIRDGNPRITVFTNDPNDKIQKGYIGAPMNPETFYSFLTLFEKVLKGPNGIKHKVDCYGARWENNRRTDERVLVSELWFGKDDNGIAWICVVAENRPKIRFNFKISDWHCFYHGDGTPFSESDGSILEANSKLALLRKVYGDAIALSILNAPPRQNTKGNGMQEYSVSSSSDEDVLF